MKKFLTLLTVLSLVLSIVCFAGSTTSTNVVTIDMDQLDETYTFKAADFTTKFATLGEGDLSRVVIVSLPPESEGTLKYDGDAITVPLGIDIADIGKLVFTPNKLFTDTTSFTWRGKTATESNSTIFETKITITDEYKDKLVKITVYKNEEYTFKENDFKSVFGDLDIGDLSRVVITSLPSDTAGVIKYNDTAVTTLPFGIDLSEIDELTFTPVANFTGKSTFNWRGKTDTESNSTVFLTQLTVIDRPAMLAKSKTLTTKQNVTLVSQFEADYADGATYSIVKQPTHGKVTLTSNTNSFQYIPTKDYIGTDTFSFKATKGTVSSNIATITINIEKDEDIIPFYYVDMQSNWANYSASHLADMNIMKGEEINGDYFFNPKRTVTRSDFVLAMLSVLDIKPASTITTATRFADDILIETWLKPYVYTAYEKNIINGSSDNGKLYFYPDKEITRAEAATIINNSIELKTNNNNSLTFKDNSEIPTWSLSAIKNMVGYEILSGYTDNTFKPKTTITRAELAEMLYKAIKEKQLESSDSSKLK